MARREVLTVTGDRYLVDDETGTVEFLGREPTGDRPLPPAVIGPRGRFTFPSLPLTEEQIRTMPGAPPLATEAPGRVGEGLRGMPSGADLSLEAPPSQRLAGMLKSQARDGGGFKFGPQHLRAIGIGLMGLSEALGRITGRGGGGGGTLANLLQLEAAREAEERRAATEERRAAMEERREQRLATAEERAATLSLLNYQLNVAKFAQTATVQQLESLPKLFTAVDSFLTSNPRATPEQKATFADGLATQAAALGIPITRDMFAGMLNQEGVARHAGAYMPFVLDNPLSPFQAAGIKETLTKRPGDAPELFAKLAAPAIIEQGLAAFRQAAATVRQLRGLAPDAEVSFSDAVQVLEGMGPKGPGFAQFARGLGLAEDLQRVRDQMLTLAKIQVPSFAAEAAKAVERETALKPGRVAQAVETEEATRRGRVKTAAEIAAAQEPSKARVARQVGAAQAEVAEEIRRDRPAPSDVLNLLGRGPMTVRQAEAEGITIPDPKDPALRVLKEQKAFILTTLRSLNTIDGILAKTPEALGLSGRVAILINNLRAQADNFLGLAGMRRDASLDPKDYAETFRRFSITGTVLKSQLITLVYALAVASGQTGRAISDRDIVMFLERVGANTQDPVALRATLRAIALDLDEGFRNTVAVSLGVRPPPLVGGVQRSKGTGPTAEAIEAMPLSELTKLHPAGLDAQQRDALDRALKRHGF